jgi:hypothetical protein
MRNLRGSISLLAARLQLELAAQVALAQNMETITITIRDPDQPKHPDQEEATLLGAGTSTGYLSPTKGTFDDPLLHAVFAVCSTDSLVNISSLNAGLVAIAAEPHLVEVKEPSRGNFTFKQFARQQQFRAKDAAARNRPLIRGRSFR